MEQYKNRKDVQFITLNMDENPGTEGFDGFGAQTDAADRIPFRVRFAGESNDRYQVDGLG